MLSNKIVLSTNYKREASTASFPTLIPLTVSLSAPLNNILLNTSTTIVNKNDEQESPCLKPLKVLN